MLFPSEEIPFCESLFAKSCSAGSQPKMDPVCEVPRTFSLGYFNWRQVHPLVTDPQVFQLLISRLVSKISPCEAVDSCSLRVAVGRSSSIPGLDQAGADLGCWNEPSSRRNLLPRQAVRLDWMGTAEVLGWSKPSPFGDHPVRARDDARTSSGCLAVRNQQMNRVKWLHFLSRC